MNLYVFYINLLYFLFFLRIKTYKINTAISNDKPTFYVNKDIFSTPSKGLNVLKQTGRSVRYLDTISANRLKKILPSKVNEIESFLSASKEYASLFDKRREISLKISELEKNLRANFYKTDAEKNATKEQISALKRESLSLRELCNSKKMEKNEFRNVVLKAYLRVPNKKMIGVPNMLPKELNIFKNGFNSKRDDEQDDDKNTHLLTHSQILSIFSNAWESHFSRMFLPISGDLTILENALIQYLMYMNTHVFGFTPVSVPCVVTSRSMYKTGHLPKFQGTIYEIKSDEGKPKFSLIPSAESSLLEMIQRKIISSHNLPLKLVSHTQCFRKENVGYGTSSKGLIRQHQFSKIELMVVTDYKSSGYWHSLLVSQVEFLLRSLGLEYNTVLLPESETPHSSACTVDVNAYFPASQDYIEISSISNTLNYQAKPLQISYSDGSKCPHILNASAFPIGRLLSCILETYQINRSGNLKIHVPECLVPYTHKKFLEPPFYK